MVGNISKLERFVEVKAVSCFENLVIVLMARWKIRDDSMEKKRC